MADKKVEITDQLTRLNLQVVAMEHILMRLVVMSAPRDHEEWMERLAQVTRRDVAMWYAPNLTDEQNEAARDIVADHVDRLMHSVIDMTTRH
ncbi:MAG: hypothetical protein H2040_04735 [Euryhalocaulis sp.]|uniref:hypothetical protein n=1 Tax=Euryhalocaulis sp. TaxID=2744307 RepID=UPI0018524AFD|nr:hypothetical protein [Euryhalocaulis sp.]MBA4801147.1 hypothetical protein [Euryhalocaulis sp.]